MSILLIDNGSKRPAATLYLRQIAESLQQQTGKAIHPVSLQHADAIDAAELDGTPANVLKAFVAEQLQQGECEFILLPLFFGRSRALTSFVPDVMQELQEEYGAFEYSLRQVLYPMPDGDPGLVDILYDNAVQAAELNGTNVRNVVLVDHGSPVQRVTAVRNHLAQQLRQRFADEVSLDEAVMERREGAEYDFNGPLLSDWLDEQAEKGIHSIIVLMQFLLPGRHAGPGGDVVEICDNAMQKHPGLQIVISPLIGEHPGIIEMLSSRLSH